MLVCVRAEGVKESETALLKGRSQVGEEALNREHLSARQKITTCTRKILAADAAVIAVAAVAH
jgi:hypothetical protein